MTILVVASDPDVRALITHMLARSGFDALGVADDAEALAVAGGADIDLLVIEVAPSFDGRSIVDHLGGRDHGVPVVYVSAWFDHPWFIAPEGDAIVTMPFSNGELEHVVAGALRRRR